MLSLIKGIKGLDVINDKQLIIHDGTGLNRFPNEYVINEETETVIVSYEKIPFNRRISKNEFITIINKRRNVMTDNELEIIKKMIKAPIKAGLIPGTIKLDNGVTMWDVIKSWDNKTAQSVSIKKKTDKLEKEASELGDKQ